MIAPALTNMSRINLRFLLKKGIQMRLILALLFATSLLASNAVANTLETQDSVSSDVDVSVTYQFVNNVVLTSSAVTTGMKIQGADVFDTVSAGDVDYSFADTTSTLTAEITGIETVEEGALTAEITGIETVEEGAVTDLQGEILATFVDNDSHYLEIGIVDDSVETLEDFNATSNKGSFFTVSTDASGEFVVTNVQMNEIVLDAPDGTGVLSNARSGSAGTNLAALRYYIAQIGDGPESDVDGSGRTFTITYTVSSTE